jgi:two-component system response regulator YesN
MVDELLAISESYRDIGQQVTQELMSAMKREEPRTELIRSIEQFFQSNLHRQISMKELCGVLNYSPTYIIRVVKQSHGMTPIEYFNKLKMDEARKMLDSGGSIKIRDIADALGFSNQHYFSKVFKQYVGCNPSEYHASK